MQPDFIKRAAHFIKWAAHFIKCVAHRMKRVADFIKWMAHFIKRTAHFIKWVAHFIKRMAHLIKWVTCARERMRCDGVDMARGNCATDGFIRRAAGYSMRAVLSTVCAPLSIGVGQRWGAFSVLTILPNVP